MSFFPAVPKNPKDCRLRRFLSGRGLCAAAITAFLLLTAVEGTWGIELHRNPVMWVTTVLLMISLGFIIFDSIKEKGFTSGTLSHIGMFLLLLGSFCGAPDFVEARIVVSSGHGENQAFSREGKKVPLPFTISLKEFDIDYYDNGVSPIQYTSTLYLDGKEFRTSVNHPCRYKGYGIYQMDFDRENGTYSVLELVRDPWLPVVFLGLLLLASGAVLSLKRCWCSWYAVAAMGVIALLFGAISLARINFGTLAPVLRSFWFIPHVALYMLAYSSLALALVTGCAAGFNQKRPKMEILSSRLFNTASSLLLLGMICGAVWAKASWGDWWTWDTKECWAAVTWLLTILGTHLPLRWQKGNRTTLIFMILAFTAMQIAWYGVDLLPAAQSSLHTYR